MNNPPPAPTSDTDTLIKTAAAKLAQAEAIDGQIKQAQANVNAWTVQRTTLLAEAAQIKEAIKSGTAWPTPAV